MRVWLATAAVVGGALFFYASSSTGVSVSAQGQATHAAITSGERIRLRFDPVKQSYECTVIDVRGDFVGCKGPDSGFNQSPDRWYNLKMIAIVERPIRQE
jgi:hypothetical protein